MRRREFITVVGGAAAMWSLAARAQQMMPVVGYLHSATKPNEGAVAGLRKGLTEHGFVEGRTVAIDIRGTPDYDRLPALARDFVRARVAVIIAHGTANTAQAAKAATTTIPIVFANGSDPVKIGLVASLNRPEGNVTGVTFLSGSLGPKRLELLRELVPHAGAIAVLVNPGNVRYEEDTAGIRAAARSVGQEIVLVAATSAGEIDAAFATIAQSKVGAVLVNGDGYFNSRREQLATLAARYQLPASFPGREYAVVGGLMGYGDDRSESFRQAGLYVARILKGEKPADLPVLQPTKFELVINLKTARTLGLTVPLPLLARADEVIE